MSTKSDFLSAKRLLEELKRCGIAHLVWLPDSESRFLYDAVTNDPYFHLIPVCREGEIIPIATGLFVGGVESICMMQSTGFFEAGDSIRGMALELNLPLLLMVGYRGWKRDVTLTDSAAFYLEPTLKAWDIPYYLIEKDEDVDKISLAHKEAIDNSRPVAVLIGAEYQ